MKAMRLGTLCCSIAINIQTKSYTENYKITAESPQTHKERIIKWPPFIRKSAIQWAYQARNNDVIMSRKMSAKDRVQMQKIVIKAREQYQLLVSINSYTRTITCQSHLWTLYMKNSVFLMRIKMTTLSPFEELIFEPALIRFRRGKLDPRTRKYELRTVRE